MFSVVDATKGLMGEHKLFLGEKWKGNDKGFGEKSTVSVCHISLAYAPLFLRFCLFFYSVFFHVGLCLWEKVRKNIK